MPRYWPLLPTTLVAFSPHLISTSQYILTEGLTCFLLVTAFYSFVRGVVRRNGVLLGVAGISLAAAYLVNPVTLFLAPIIVCVAQAGATRTLGEHRTNAMKIVLLVCAPVILTAALWAARSAITVPEDSPTSSARLLTNLVQGMHENYHALWRADPRDPDNPATVDFAAIDGSFTEFTRLLARRFAEDPLGMARWYFIDKPILLWEWDIRVGVGDIYTYPVFYSLYETSRPALISYSVMKGLHFLLFGCAVLGVVWFRCDRTGPRWIPVALYASVVYLSCVYSVTHADPRYSVPLRPEMYILAAYSLWRCLEFYRVWKAKQSPGEQHEAMNR
jgi:4-amino-4-deoxy-L-arabinose transferase-like glycosyltransferase